jgi:hypothetical protein
MMLYHHVHFHQFTDTHCLAYCILSFPIPLPLDLLFEPIYGHDAHIVSTCLQIAFCFQLYWAFHAHPHSTPSF